MYIQLALDNLNTRKLKHLGKSNFCLGPLTLQTFSRLKNLHNSNTRKLEHCSRSNSFFGPGRIPLDNSNFSLPFHLFAKTIELF